MEPGMYRKPSVSQLHMQDWHTDHWEFYYLNTAGNWADIGWGNEPSDQSDLELMVGGNLRGATEVPEAYAQFANAGQFAAAWNTAGTARRDDLAVTIRQALERSTACFVRNHEGTIGRLREQVRAAQEQAWNECAEGWAKHLFVQGAGKPTNPYTQQGE